MKDQKIFALHKKITSQSPLFILIIKDLRAVLNHKKIHISFKIKLYQYYAGSIRRYKNMKISRRSGWTKNLKIITLKIQLSLFNLILYHCWKTITKLCLSMSKARDCKVIKSKSIFWANIGSDMLNQWIPLCRNFIATFFQERPNLNSIYRNTRVCLKIIWLLRWIRYMLLPTFFQAEKWVLKKIFVWIMSKKSCIQTLACMRFRVHWKSR